MGSTAAGRELPLPVWPAVLLAGLLSSSSLKSLAKKTGSDLFEEGGGGRGSGRWFSSLFVKGIFIRANSASLVRPSPEAPHCLLGQLSTPSAQLSKYSAWGPGTGSAGIPPSPVQSALFFSQNP